MGRLICAVCGDRIGVYEPFFYVQPDGSLISSSFRAIQDGRHRLHPEAVLLHGPCESKSTFGGGPARGERDHPRGSGG